MSHADSDNQDANQPPHITVQPSIPPSDTVTQPLDNAYPKIIMKERKNEKKNLIVGDIDECFSLIFT
jgi:hypothetical protein